MASLIVISWRDVPAQVVVKRGRETAKIQLSQRFQEAVDRAAMRAGRGSSDAYLEDWRRAAPVACGEELHAEAQAAAAAIEARYTDEDLERLIRAKGIDVNLPDPFKPAADAGKA
jgi:Virulence factor